MPELPMSKAQVNKLGVLLRDDRLRSGSPEWNEYHRFLAFCDAVREEVAAVVATESEGMPVTNRFDASGRIVTSSRTKTTDTLRDKLQRLDHQDLIRVDDVVGIRVVGDFDLKAQDDLARRLTRNSALARAKVKDRRQTPSHGYRAVHVIARHSEVHVEIQIRTYVQALWADAFERLADVWGRQIRYGEPPYPDATGTNSTRVAFLEQMDEVSQDSQSIEEMLTLLLHRERDPFIEAALLVKAGADLGPAVLAQLPRSRRQKVKKRMRFAAAALAEYEADRRKLDVSLHACQEDLLRFYSSLAADLGSEQP